MFMALQSTWFFMQLVSHETIRKAVETANKVNIRVPGGGGGDDISNKDPGS